jgi:uncharacterized protein (TIGR02145 family)
MKNIFFHLLLFSSFSAAAQTQQNINKNTGTVSNAITSIDSIRFTGSSSDMEVVLQNGNVESHTISNILNVNFALSNENSCDAINVFNSNLNYGSMTDQEGNVYKTIVIGTQEWMAENLKTSIYRNGEAIHITGTSFTTGAWSLNNDSQYDCPYGKLYNWYAVVDSRNVCPTGWNVPTDAEWTTLTDYLGGQSDENYNFFAGGKMKSTGFQYWLNPNTAATNESGFSGLPAGIRIFDGSYSSLGNNGFWWSCSELDTYSGWGLLLDYNFGYSYRLNNDKASGFSVRCLKD